MAVAPAPPRRPARHWRFARPTSGRMAGLLKDAGVAALIAALLALPFIGLETYDIGGGALGVRTHFDRVALCRRGGFRRPFRDPAVPPAPYRRLAGQRPAAGAGRGLEQPPRRPDHGIGVAFAVALPFLPFSSRYLVDLGTTC